MKVIDCGYSSQLLRIIFLVASPCLIFGIFLLEQVVIHHLRSASILRSNFRSTERSCFEPTGYVKRRECINKSYYIKATEDDDVEILPVPFLHLSNVNLIYGQATVTGRIAFVSASISNLNCCCCFDLLELVRSVHFPFRVAQ